MARSRPDYETLRPEYQDEYGLAPAPVGKIAQYRRGATTPPLVDPTYEPMPPEFSEPFPSDDGVVRAYRNPDDPSVFRFLPQSPTAEYETLPPEQDAPPLQLTPEQLEAARRGTLIPGNPDYVAPPPRQAFAATAPTTGRSVMTGALEKVMSPKTAATLVGGEASGGPMGMGLADAAPWLGGGLAFDDWQDAFRNKRGLGAEAGASAGVALTLAGVPLGMTKPITRGVRRVVGGVADAFSPRSIADDIVDTQRPIDTLVEDLLGSNYGPHNQPTSEAVVGAGHELRAPQVPERTRTDALPLSTAERNVVRQHIERLNEINAAANKPRTSMRAVIDSIAETKRAYPESEGWAPIEVKSFNNKGEPVYGVVGGSGYKFDKLPPNLESVAVPLRAEVSRINKLATKAKKAGNAAEAERLKGESRRVSEELKGVHDRHRNNMAQRVTDDIIELNRRGAAGDHDALVMLRQASWYHGLKTRLRTEFGGFGGVFADLLGATSPNTQVPQNFDSSVAAIRKFLNGDYDEIMDQFIRHLEGGGTATNYTGPVPRKDNNAKFGMNSNHVMKAFADLWRVTEKGQAPKARNFSGNLIGKTTNATIDVWAARYLRRIWGDEAGVNRAARIPPPAEHGVKGELNVDTPTKPEDISGEFGMGQSVLDDAAKRLEAAGIKSYDGRRINADDLQAMSWFLEKDLWRRNRWTSEGGEGGSFEQSLDAMPSERYNAGVSMTRNEAPTNEATAQAQAQLLGPLRQNPKVVAVRAEPTYGNYDKQNERSFDVEIVTEPGFDPNDLTQQMAQFGKDNGQTDVFISRVVPPKMVDLTPNARPGVEIYFQDRKSMERLKPLLEEIRKEGGDGFTFIADTRSGTPDPLSPRMRDVEGGADPSGYVGIRMQWVPEIAMRFDADFMKAYKADPEAALEKYRAEAEDLFATIADRAHESPGVNSSNVVRYDTQVFGQESYDDILQGKLAGTIGSSFDYGRNGIRRLGDHVEKRVAYLDGRRGGHQERPDAGSAADVSGGVSLDGLARGGRLPAYERLPAMREF